MGGISVAFSVKVTNKGQVKSEPFMITTTTVDWFDTNPFSWPDSWKFIYPGVPLDAKRAVIQGPVVLPGKSLVLKWHTYFLTPFSPHYIVKVNDPSVPGWGVWTSVTIC